MVPVRQLVSTICGRDFHVPDVRKLRTSALWGVPGCWTGLHCGHEWSRVVHGCHGFRRAAWASAASRGTRRTGLDAARPRCRQGTPVRTAAVACRWPPCLTKWTISVQAIVPARGVHTTVGARLASTCVARHVSGRLASVVPGTEPPSRSLHPKGRVAAVARPPVSAVLRSRRCGPAHTATACSSRDPGVAEATTWVAWVETPRRLDVTAAWPGWHTTTTTSRRTAMKR